MQDDAQRADRGAGGDARFQSIFEGASIGIARIDGEGHAYEANGPCQEMLGYTEAELANLTFVELIHPDHLSEQLVLHAELMAGRRQHYELEKRYLCKDGSELWCQTRTTLVRGDGDDGPSAIAMIQDITERKLADIELRAKSSRLALIVETQRDIAMAGNDLDRVLALIGERSMELTRADGAMVSLVDGDELVMAAACGTAESTLNTRRKTEESIANHAFTSHTALLIEHSDTDPRINARLHAIVQDRSLIAVPLFHGDAPVASLIVVRMSETDRLGAEELQTLELIAVMLGAAISRAAEFNAKREQLEMLARFQVTYSSALVGMMMLGPEGTISDANPAMHKLLAAVDGDLDGRSIVEFLPTEDMTAVLSEFEKREKLGADTMRAEHRLEQTTGDTVWVDSSISSVRDADGNKTFDIVLMQDITKRKAAEDALRAQAEMNEYQALHDALTDLPNRTLFRDRLGQAVESAKRQSRNAAILMIDLDGFKEINDSLGHSAGDEVLVELSRRLKAVTRGGDTAARLGGDEFAILLADVRVPEDVERVVERVQNAFADPIIARGRRVEITAPIGISVAPNDGDSIDTLIHAADLAMYQAKRTRVTHVFHHDMGVETPQPPPVRRLRAA
jgi:diguanylate cyclase (GGDEF)-like protein/PAS domain S-box-containing protein